MQIKQRGNDHNTITHSNLGCVIIALKYIHQNQSECNMECDSQEKKEKGKKKTKTLIQLS